ncbi:cora-like Mg2+ transporter protein-domain-containing protein [Syncephalastrum racemosum]|uniref:Cora-like Mg2+ transporter protein-domain-containing protein n=1 Tax=Syncephalastrum racemosum TaxID=13706 RepID=A0A1X2HNE8_SYNRA|nr:cora-like Mg2+ transporter protein-domain-containing protein [Syncephalastrum racemosum]
MDCKTDSARFTLYDGATGYNTVYSLDQTTPYAQWIDVYRPSHQELQSLADMFAIHPLTLNDLTSQTKREKCDLFSSYLFVSCQTLQHSMLYCIISEHCILTFHYDLVRFDRVRERIGEIQPYTVQVTPTWIGYAILDDLVLEFDKVTQHLALEVENLDDGVMGATALPDNTLVRIASCRKRVTHLVHHLSIKQDVLKVLLKAQTDIQIYFEDLQARTNSFLQHLSHCEIVLARTHANYLGQISIELTQASNKTSHVMSRLTIFATVLLPMNLVTGLWGVNVKVPGRDYDSLVCFYWILGCLGLVAMLSFTIARQWSLV